MILVIVATLTSTTFTFVMIVLISTMAFPSKLDAFFPWNIFYIYTQSIILCPFKPWMWQAYELFFWPLWGWLVAFVVITMGSPFFSTLHISTLWLSLPQFMQCLLIFPGFVCSFIITANLKNFDTNSALWAFVGVIPSSHSKAASLCNYNMVRFILEVAILK